MEFHELLQEAKAGDRESMETLFLMYRPLIIRQSMIEGRFCEDLYQELSATFLHCINKFHLDL